MGAKISLISPYRSKRGQSVEDEPDKEAVSQCSALTRSNPYQGHPCHIEIFLSTPSAEVSRSKDLDVASSSKKSKKTVQAIEA